MNAIRLIPGSRNGRSVRWEHHGSAVLMLITIFAISGVVSAMEPQELITDQYVQAGVNAKHPVTGAIEGPIQYTTAYGDPVWGLAQWNSLQSLYGATPTTLPSGSKKWANAYKSVTMGPLESSDADLILAVNSDAEYDGVFREAGEPWPHLLIEQRISEPGGLIGTASPWISQMTEVNFNLDAKLVYANNNHDQGAGYNSSIHAAHYLFYCTIQNLKTGSPTYGNYLWFGITPYDDRWSTPGGLYAAGDAGTGKFIYNIGLAPFSSQVMQVGQWKNLKKDILPYIKSAIDYARTTPKPGGGYWLDPATTYADYKIGAMNMGWEVSGLSIVTMQTKNFSIGVYGYNYPRGYAFDTNGDREGWTTQQLTDTNNGPLNGTWVCTATSGSDPKFIGPTNFHMNAATFKKVIVKAANAAPSASTFTLYWKRSGDTTFTAQRSKSVSIPGGGGWGERTLDMTGHSYWNGDIVQLRIDPVNPGTGYSFGIDYIRYE